ncbi:MAG: DUF1007 family protein [Pseudomonadota bacterium]
MDRIHAHHTPQKAKLCATACAGLLLVATPAVAHPHVFIDGGVDFQFAEDETLTALKVTWLYDEFETLYLLASNNLSLNAEGGLDEADRLTLEQKFSEWPEDFDGSAHLMHDGAPVALAWPSDPEVQLIDGRIQAVFTRALEAPMTLIGSSTELAFYESTYFFAFKVTNIPQLMGGSGACVADVIPFKPDPNDASVLTKLAMLSREETPDDENVGLLFADRIALKCG